MIKTKRVLHFSIPVTNLDRSLAFYRDLLGCTLVHSNPVMRFMSCGDFAFVLTKVHTHVPANAPRDTLHHNAFVVDREDFDAAVAEIQAAGYELISYEDSGHRTFPGRHAYFYDPDQNAVEIIDYRPEEKADGDGPALLKNYG